MPSFPLLRLPFLAQVEVARHLDLVDLVQFSLLSPDTKLIAYDTRTQIPETFVTFYPLKNCELALNILSLFESTMRIVVPPLSGTLRPAFKSEHTITVPWAEPTEEGRFEALYKMCLHILEVFKVCSFTRQTCEPFDALKLSKLDLEAEETGIMLMGADAMISGFPAVTAETMHYALDKLNNFSLCVFGDVEKGFKYSKPLTRTMCLIINNINSRHSFWLNFESLLNASCEHIVIRNPNAFTRQQLNMLLKKWTKGEALENLKTFSTLAPRLRTVQDTLDTLLEGIEAVPWNVKKRDTNGNCEEFLKGRKIRKINGRAGHVYIENGYIEFDVCGFN